VENTLLDWVRNTIQETMDKYNIKVTDISTCWTDGKALGALIDRMLKDKFGEDIAQTILDYERDVIFSKLSSLELNNNLVNIANEHLEVPNLISAESLQNGPEKLSMCKL